jgi:amino acid adenylation domain-containing protein
MNIVPERTAPLSYEQERLYLFEELDSSATASNVAFIYWITGELDVAALDAAITELHRRHEVLRTRYPNVSTQEVLPPGGSPVEHVDVRSAADPDAEVRRRVTVSIGEPFDLAAPPVRWTCHVLGPDRHALSLVVHHIAIDAWSKGLINQEISALYQAFHAGHPAELEPPRQYADYAVAQRARPDSEARADLDHWVTELAGLPGPIRLPFDRTPTERTGFRGDLSRTLLPDTLIAAVRGLAIEARSSEFMVLLAAFAWQLSRHGDQRDFAIGVPNAGRTDPELDPVLGCFVDTRPCRVRLAGTPTFRELLAQIRDTTLDGYQHSCFSVERVVAALRPKREPGREPLVQVNFSVTNAPEGRLDLTGLRVVEESGGSPSTALDLAVILTDVPGGLDMSWYYKTDLFDASTVDRLVVDFERVLRWATGNPDTPLTEFTGWTGATGTAAAQTAAAPARSERRSAQPRGEVERIVARIWCEVLELDSVDVDEDFFELGGHSLLAARIVARLGELVPGLPVRGVMRDVLRHPTVEEFATVLADRMIANATQQAAPRVPVIHRGPTLPLSSAQKRLWILDQLGDGTEFLVPMLLRITGPLDVDVLAAALKEILARHEVLRTGVTAVDDEPVGVVRPATAFTLGVTDVTEPELTAALTAETTRPLDLGHGFPLRARAFRIDPTEHVLCLTMHHMAVDGWSLGLLYDELATLYEAFAAGRPSPLAELTVQYADVAVYQEARQADAEFAAKLDFWRTELAGAEPFELRPDLPRPARRSTTPGRGGRHPFTVPADVVAGLERIAAEHGATLFMTLLAAWQVLLHRYSGADDITVGTTAADRELTESEPLIGFFINMLVLRGDVSGRPSFVDLLARTRERTLEAYAHQDVPFDRLVGELTTDRSPGVSPLFQIVIRFDTTRQRAAELPGLAVRPVLPPAIPVRYDIDLAFVAAADGLAGDLIYDARLYRPETVDALVRHFGTLLAGIVADPAARIDRLPVMDAVERADMSALTARPEVEFPPHCLHELFRDQAARTPDAVAVLAGEDTVTYAELDAWSDAVAGRLAELGAGPDVVVAVLLDRSVAMVAALLGVLKAGSAYLPIEPDTPPARIEQLLADSAAPVCLVEPNLTALAESAGSRALTVPGRTSGVDSEPAAPAVGPDHLVSVYYTSGSTGRPKGVASTHAGWVNRMCWMQRHHPLAPGETVLHKTTLTFDDSAVEIFWPLLAGGRVAVLEAGLHRDPRAIADAVIRYGAVHVQFVPSMLELFLDTVTADDVTRMPALRSVLSSGEALRPELVARFRSAFGAGILLDNTWGATEVSIDSTCRVCRAEDGAGTGAVSVGRPIDNNEVRVLDGWFDEPPVGVAGELCIGGVGVARGYLGDPRRTAEVFVPHPDRPGERLYRTGDWGRVERDGTLTYLRRRDDQVKIRGVRVELGEVEHALRTHPAVTDVAVFAWTAAPGDKRLAAYAAGRCTPAELLEHARGLLSGYAVPGSITVLDALPRLPNGKLDRRGLPSPELVETSDEYVAPRTATEEVLAGIWASVLGREKVGVDDDFFGIGGHSLLATRAIARMRQVFAADLPLPLIFEQPTVARAAAAVEEVVHAEIAALSDEEARRLLGQAAVDGNGGM